MKKQKNRGFTLIELLVVIAIIGVLIALIMPAIASTRERAHTVSCMNNMKQLAMAAFMYADDHEEVIPSIAPDPSHPDYPNDPNLANSPYLDDENVYICPRDTRSDLGATKPSYTPYEYTPPSLLPSDVNGLFSERVLYVESDKAGIVNKSEITGRDVTYRHDGRCVAVFADGHVVSGSYNEMTTFLGVGIPEGGIPADPGD